MSNRHLSRTLVMQALFEWDFRGKPADRLGKIFDHCRAEFAPDFDDGNFSEELLRKIIEHLDTLDATIQKFAPEWPIDQITIIDRNVLRIGVYELVHAADIPARVAINEAIELAKTFGGESSGRFVNGVLGALYRDLVAQGKVKDIDKEELPSKDKEKAGSKET